MYIYICMYVCMRCRCVRSWRNYSTERHHGVFMPLHCVMDVIGWVGVCVALRCTTTLWILSPKPNSY